jgi:hypothetical protein
MYVITIDPGSELNQLRKEDAGIVGSSGWHDEQQMLTQLVGDFKHVLCSRIYGIKPPTIDFHIFQDC